LKLSLHPSGLAPRILNLEQWRSHVLARLHRQVELTADAQLAALLEELRGYAAHGDAAHTQKPLQEQDYAGVVVPLRLRSPLGTLALFSTITVFGTPIDITLAELAIESFFPADPQTAEALRRAAADWPRSAS
jgi:hypothetical protein